MRLTNQEKSIGTAAIRSQNASVTNRAGLGLHDHQPYILSEFAPLNPNEEDMFPMEPVHPEYKLPKEGDPMTTSTKSQLSCNARLHEFTQNSTLHGIRYICMEGAFILRRFLWLVLVLLCMGLMSYQIIDRIIYFYSWPVTVNVEVNYNKSLVFPSVTICNQNQFRISKAAEIAQYKLLDALYTRTGKVNSSFLHEYQANNLTFYELFTLVSHQKEDLIVSCTWGREQCGPENFTMIITDHGVCYTFSQEINGYLRKAATTGADNGLRLLLNVEQYEYMPGPHDAAGVKILMHNIGEFPKVHELGLATPTGTHAFVGLKIVSLSNLPQPRGNCSTKVLKYFPAYTPENCEIDCFTEELSKTCNCRLKFMPQKNGVPPLCTLQQYYECYLPKRDGILHHVRRYCSCPIPCDTILYDSSVSYASTSSFAADSLLNKVASGVEDKFLLAREVSSRVVVERFNHSKQLIIDLDVAFDNLKRLFNEKIDDRLDKQVKLLSDLYNDTVKQALNKIEMNKYQTYSIEKNFLRVREAMEERTLKYLAFDYLNFIYIIESRLRELAGTELSDEKVRKFLYLMILNNCNANIEKGNKAMGNYTELLESFRNGTPIFNYQYKSIPRSHNKFIVPKPLLSRALTHSWYAIKYSKKVPFWIKKIQKSLRMYIDLANETFVSHDLNETRMYEISEIYNKACKNYNFAKSAFYFYSVDWSKEQVVQKEQVTESLLEKYESIANDMKINLQNLASLLQSLQNNIMRNLTVTSQLAIDYLNYETNSKRTLAKIFTSANIRQGINELKTFFIEIRARGSTLFDSWNKLATASINIWKNILMDVDLQDYYVFINRTDYLEDVANVTQNILDEHQRVRDENDLRELVGNTDRVFLYCLENVIIEMAEFEESLKMDSNFLRENFLELAIFYRELSYEQITQQVGYDIFSLFCDIGGSMGLFIGASVLTMFEIVEFIFSQSLRAAFLRKKKN